MITPKLHNTVRVRLAQVDPARMPAVDPQFQEPMATPAYKAPVELSGQHVVNVTDAYQQRPGGDFPDADGAFTFRAVDLASAGVVLRKGDRVTGVYVGQAGELATDWTVVRVEPRAFYLGAPRLFMAFYKRPFTESAVA